MFEDVFHKVNVKMSLYNCGKQQKILQPAYMLDFALFIAYKATVCSMF